MRKKTLGLLVGALVTTSVLAGYHAKGDNMTPAKAAIIETRVDKMKDGDMMKDKSDKMMEDDTKKGKSDDMMKDNMKDKSDKMMDDDKMMKDDMKDGKSDGMMKDDMKKDKSDDMMKDKSDKMMDDDKMMKDKSGKMMDGDMKMDKSNKKMKKKKAGKKIKMKKNNGKKMKKSDNMMKDNMKKDKSGKMMKDDMMHGDMKKDDNMMHDDMKNSKSMKKKSMKKDKMMNKKDMYDFTLKDLDGNDYKLSDNKGKKVYMKFWASWCSICLTGLEDLDKLAVENNDFEIVTVVAPGKNREMELAAFKKWFKGLGYKNLKVFFDETGEVTEHYGIKVYPTSVYVSSNGADTTIKAGHNSNDDIKETIKEIK